MSRNAPNATWAALAAAGAALAAAAWAGTGPEAPATRPRRIAYGRPRQIATLGSRTVNESSGLAAGRVNPGIFWTHNDSGDAAVVYAFNAKGEHLATCTAAGAANLDWEDMCSFTLDGKGVLLMGDVGDNLTLRGYCTLYALHEPKLDPAKRRAELNVSIVEKVHFRYADGAHNCEAIGFDPTSRTVIIVTKDQGPCNVYLLPWPKAPADRPVTLKAVATLKIPTTTAMDVSPDGRRAVVLTYGSAYEYTRGQKESWAAAFKRRPRVLKMPRRRQGESICYGPDGRSLYLTSEMLPTPLWEVPAKAAPSSRPAGK